MCYSERTMSGGKHLLLLAVFVLLERCHPKPTVVMSPQMVKIFTGDILYLSCDNNPSDGEVKWYLDNQEKTQRNKTWRIAVASPTDSASYECEHNGQRSDKLTIDVLDYAPSASLTIKTGQPVMKMGGAVVLQLVNEDSLDGWNCWVYRTSQNQRKKIVFKPETSNTVSFQPRELTVPETIFWCSDRTQEVRSNQVIVRTSTQEQEIFLEMYPLPAVAGDTLTLKCLVWGTDQIKKTVFYKNNLIINHDASPTYVITNVTESARGSYKCDATYTHIAQTAGPPNHRVSDTQEVFVQVPPIKAVLSANNGLSCSCSVCGTDNSYRWYHKDEHQQWVTVDAMTSNSMTPTGSGSFACRAVWKNKRSLMSNSYTYTVVSDANPLVFISLLVVFMLLLLIGLVVCYKCYKKRNTTSPIYEDVELRLRGDDKYEKLQGAKKEAEYDSLHPEAAGGTQKVAEYEALKKEGMKEGVYHTLGTEGPAGGEAGYEALKKEGMKEGVYHTLGTEGPAGGDAGYEALKKEGMKEGVYHTLGMEGAAGGEGGYEALKKEGMKEGVYHTLGTEGAAAGEGGHKAAGEKDEDK